MAYEDDIQDEGYLELHRKVSFDLKDSNCSRDFYTLFLRQNRRKLNLDATISSGLDGSFQNDIIIDYPDSQPALQDLKECLARVDQRSELVTALRKA